MSIYGQGIKHLHLTLLRFKMYFSLSLFPPSFPPLSLSLFLFIYTYIYMFVCVCVCVCVSIYIYIYIYTHTHTQIHCALRRIWPNFNNVFQMFWKQTMSYNLLSSRYPIHLTVSAFIHEYTTNFQLFFIIIKLKFYKFVRFQNDYIAKLNMLQASLHSTFLLNLLHCLSYASNDLII